MKKQNLILLCDNYPTSAGEFFIDDEMRVIAPFFQKIIIIQHTQTPEKLNRFVSENMQVCSYENKITINDKFKSLPFLFKKFFVKELFYIKKTHPKKLYFKLFKIMYMDVVRALILKKVIKQTIITQQLNYNNTILYSYWHDYKALALSILKNKNTQITCFARAHGWDNFRERQNPPYLPFKNHILQNLLQTFTISKAGKIEFMRYGNFENKITVSYLGKHNHRKPLITKNNSDIHIVSCSAIIPVKRVNIIIDCIAQLKLTNIKWTHFGDGNLRNKIENYATKKLSQNCSFEFKGMVANDEILDFYAKNYIDLFINLSASEGIPVSIMEALSAGIPVLATNVGGTAEAVNEDNGFLVEQKFNLSVATKIIQNYLSLHIQKQAERRKNAYLFWQKNYEATKNYTEFYTLINPK